jgi:ribosome-binding factor A
MKNQEKDSNKDLQQVSPEEVIEAMEHIGEDCIAEADAAREVAEVADKPAEITEVAVKLATADKPEFITVTKPRRVMRQFMPAIAAALVLAVGTAILFQAYRRDPTELEPQATGTSDYTYATTHDWVDMTTGFPTDTTVPTSTYDDMLQRLFSFGSRHEFSGGYVTHSSVDSSPMALQIFDTDMNVTHMMLPEGHFFTGISWDGERIFYIKRNPETNETTAWYSNNLQMTDERLIFQDRREAAKRSSSVRGLIEISIEKHGTTGNFFFTGTYIHRPGSPMARNPVNKWGKWDPLPNAYGIMSQDGEILMLEHLPDGVWAERTATHTPHFVFTPNTAGREYIDLATLERHDTPFGWSDDEGDRWGVKIGFSQNGRYIASVQMFHEREISKSISVVRVYDVASGNLITEVRTTQDANHVYGFIICDVEKYIMAIIDNRVDVFNFADSNGESRINPLSIVVELHFRHPHTFSHGDTINNEWSVVQNPDTGLFSIVDSQGRNYIEGLYFDELRTDDDEQYHYGRGQIRARRHNSNQCYWMVVQCDSELSLNRVFVTIPIHGNPDGVISVDTLGYGYQSSDFPEFIYMVTDLAETTQELLISMSLDRDTALYWEEFGYGISGLFSGNRTLDSFSSVRIWGVPRSNNLSIEFECVFSDLSEPQSIVIWFHRDGNNAEWEIEGMSHNSYSGQWDA